MNNRFKDCTNEQLLTMFEGACYHVVHNETKSNVKWLEKLQAEILKRMEGTK